MTAYSSYRFNNSSSPIQPTSYPSPSSSHPVTSSSPRPSPTLPKRKQVKNACINCQKACKKCDDQRPCSRCIKYGIEDGCINSQRKERKRKNDSGNNHSNHSNPSKHDNTSNHGYSNNQTSPYNNSNNNSMMKSMQLRQESPRQMPMRLSVRNAIRPFPRELLESLQNDDDDNDEKEVKGVNEDESELVSSPIDHVQELMCPKVTEEFKTLAKICSELHTHLTQIPQQLPSQNIPTTASQISHPQPQQSFYHRQQPQAQLNPFMMMMDGRSPMRVDYNNNINNSNSNNNGINTINQQYQHHQQQNHYYYPQHQSCHQLQEYPVKIDTSTLPPLLQRRSVSPPTTSTPPKLLLKPTSPIYPLQPQFYPRDLMNRTPPEETDTPVKSLSSTEHTQQPQ